MISYVYQCDLKATCTIQRRHSLNPRALGSCSDSISNLLNVGLFQISFIAAQDSTCQSRGTMPFEKNSWGNIRNMLQYRTGQQRTEMSHTGSHPEVKHTYTNQRLALAHSAQHYAQIRNLIVSFNFAVPSKTIISSDSWSFPKKR